MACAVRVQSGDALSPRGALPGRTALRRLMERAVRAALRHQHAADAEISITLLDDDEIAGMNGEFLGHEGVTDVISFALYEGDETPIGDVYIGYRQAVRQAEGAGVPVEEELARLAIHGVLHVLGHDHPDGADRLESPMWAVQEDILARTISE